MLDGLFLPLPNAGTDPARLKSRVFPRLHSVAGLLRACALACALPVAAHADAYQFGFASVTFDGYEVTFHNGLTSARDFPAEFSFELTEGITVQVIILHGPGTTPDVMYVIPPAGYFAVPESVTVDEDASGVIAIYGGVS